MLQLAGAKEKRRTAITILYKSAKCYEPKQRFEGSASAKSLGPDRRKVNSPRAQVKGELFVTGIGDFGGNKRCLATRRRFLR